MSEQGRNITASTPERITEELSGLPLAIRQLGSYLLATSLEPADILHHYQLDRATASVVDEWDEVSPLSYRHTLANVWKFSFDRQPEAALSLLNVMFLLDPDKILHEALDDENSLHELSVALNTRARYVAFMTVFCEVAPSYHIRYL